MPMQAATPERDASLAELTFARELLNSIYDDILPLLAAHYNEIASYRGLPLEPDFSQYESAEKFGKLRIYTARDKDRKLLGYAVFFLLKHLHSKNITQAYQDLVFIHKDRRGFGGSFIDWCDRQLAADGAGLIYRCVNRNFDFGSMLERKGYSQIDTVYERRI